MGCKTCWKECISCALENLLMVQPPSGLDTSTPFMLKHGFRLCFLQRNLFGNHRLVNEASLLWMLPRKWIRWGRKTSKLGARQRERTLKPLSTKFNYCFLQNVEKEWQRQGEKRRAVIVRNKGLSGPFSLFISISISLFFFFKDCCTNPVRKPKFPFLGMYNGTGGEVRRMCRHT